MRGSLACSRAPGMTVGSVDCYNPRASIRATHAQAFSAVHAGRSRRQVSSFSRQPAPLRLAGSCHSAADSRPQARSSCTTTGCAAPPSAQRAAAPLFEEIPSSASGITWVHKNAMSADRYLPETMGPGVAFFDYDNDGWIDIFMVNSGARPTSTSRRRR